MRRQWSRTHTAVVVALAGVALVTVAAAQPSTSFTASERRRLVGGELVSRPMTRTEDRSNYLGGTSWQRVAAPRDEVWRVVQDPRHYPRLIPGVEVVRVIERRSTRRLIFLRHRYGLVTASYHAWVRTDPETHTLHFELDRARPRDVRAGRGFLTVEPYRGESIVTWGVRVDIGAGSLSGVLEPLVRHWLLKVPWCVRGFIESDQPTC